MPPKNGKRTTHGKQEPAWKPTVACRNPEPISWFHESGYTNITDSIPICKEFGKNGNLQNLQTPFQIVNWTPTEDNHGTITIKENGVQTSHSAYKKVIPLIDPYKWAKNEVRVKKEEILGDWTFAPGILQQTYRKGYVDCLASYLVGNYATAHNSPHFLKYFGAFRALSEKYMYDLKDDFESMRFQRWFWENIHNESLNLQVFHKEEERYLSKDEIYELFKPDDELLEDDDYNSEEEDEADEKESILSSLSAISIESEAVNTPYVYDQNTSGELESVSSFQTKDEEVYNIHKDGQCDSVREHYEDDENVSDTSFSDMFGIHLVLENMPVLLMFTEKADGTFDDFVENPEPIWSLISTNDEYYPLWSAWLFQIIASLQILQKNYNFTHNDLHTNNVVWKKTEKPYLYYKKDSTIWKIPTHGYIFQIIDFGRAIFQVQNKTMISSDFYDEEEACGQYNFGPIYDDSYPQIGPNKSFDLCRFACSFIRPIFEENPPEKPKGKIITQEKDGFKVVETVNSLFNLLWSWTASVDGDSIFEGSHGEEKYPNFKLYVEIASQAKNAVPENQLHKSIFQEFIMKQGTVEGHVIAL